LISFTKISCLGGRCWRGSSFGDQGGNLNGRQPDARIADVGWKKAVTFFEKKVTKKTLLLWALALPVAQPPVVEVFLVTPGGAPFFQKK
jgi:hypothetical protein